METIDYRGCKINIIQDEHAENPRNWDNLGTMVCFHNKYILGDEKHDINKNDFDSWKEMESFIINKKNAAIILPLYLYDHSGITIYTTGDRKYHQYQHENFDSMQVGFIYISKEKMREEYNVKRINKKLIERVTEYLRGEIETYDQYLTNECYGYDALNVNGESINSCYGYYGYDHKKSGLLEAAKSEIDADLKEKGVQLKLEIETFS